MSKQNEVREDSDRKRGRGPHGGPGDSNRPREQRAHQNPEKAAQLSGSTSRAPAFRVRSAARKSPAVRRRLMLALAAAEEELMSRHASAAADFVRETADELPFERSLSIYMRLVNVPARDRRNIAVRALAVLGDAMPPERFPTEAAERDRMIDRILRRVRGRQDTRLRAWVGAAAARARDSAHHAHLAGVRSVANALDGVVEPAEAVQYYIEAMDVEPGWAESIFHDALPQLDTSAGQSDTAAD